MGARLLCFTLACVCLLTTATAEQSPVKPKDPCQRVFCTKGRMCVVNEDRSTTCVCPESCPEEYNPVCSVYRTEFNNKCELHKFACRLGVMVGIERQGKCDDEGDKWKWGPCSTSSLQQFHDRYLEYLMFAREKELDPDFPLESKRLESLTYEERKAIIEWEFYGMDKNHNDILDKDEIKLMIDPNEDCMIGFMKSCDYDQKPGISRKEWNECFPPISPEVNQDAMDFK